NNLITVDALGGDNTKINFIDIVTPGAGGLRPYVTATTPTNGETGVECSGSVGADVYLPNVGQGVDASTLTAESVKLYRSLDKAELPVTHGTTGGGDAIILQSIVPLEPNTTYTFEITNEAEDLSGAAFLPYQMTYTTGACTAGGPGSGVEFEQIVVSSGDKYSSLQVGPDGKLYASTIDGRIVRWDINPDGTLANAETITSLQTANGGPRVTTGIAFDPASTAVDLTLYVSNTTFGFNGMPDWGGKITRLSGPNLENVQDLIINLPRSIRDHVTNGIAFGPDGALYFNQGSNSAMGAPDNAWGNRPERTLSAATLRLDLTALNSLSLPLDVQTQEGGTYDPFAPGAPLTIFASGVRNAYDLVWHSNGQLYVPANGSAGGGNAPGTPTVLPAVCQTRVDDAINGDYVGPTVPAALNVEKQNDFLFRIPSGGGGYYGHPNPERCEWVLNGGNPTAVADPNEVLRYIPGTQPDRNYEGDAYNFGFNKSPNGVIEYKSNTFSGALAGKILVVRYSLNDDIIVLDPSGTNGDISGEETNIPGFSGFSDPLELIEGPNGTIYISEYGSNELTLLRPTNITAEPNIVVAPEQLVFDAVVNSGPTAVQSVNIQNTGTADLVISHAYLTGLTPDQFHFVVTPTLPLTVTASSGLNLDFQFDPTAVGVSGAVLQIVSNDTGHPLESVSLRGLGRVGDGGTDEPSLQWILDTFEIGVDVGDDDPTTSEIHSDTSTAKMNTYLGDEVVAQAFRRASAGNVTVQPLAVFAPTSSDPITEVGWYASGNPASAAALFTVGNTPASNGQRLNPAVVGTTSFNPGAATFGFYSRWPVYSDRFVFSEDPLNTFGSAIPHHMRVYQLRD
ncbi:MAG: choice-of-anchor D domain-containing protein, partial [Anaerolineales bacterium]|nr:choice-of-anchor D domain-containing protein [Anaerolineales bacterium]